MAPFWGPKTAAAPSGPSSGWSTSLATVTRTPCIRSRRPLRSTAVTPGQRAAAAGDVAAVAIGHPGPEGLDHPHSAVGGGAATQSEHDLGGSGGHRVGDHLPEPVRRGAQRVQAAARQPVETDGGGELDDGALTVDRVRGLDRLAGRAGHGHGAAGEAGRESGGDGAVTSVGDRCGPDVDVRPDRP